ncbi:hypothetical protein MLD38_011666 [Melastoma candidum]|uniref:Uncharacterized protein n=1 Tax=Melastoma candidum TaxID=119954 RepID=A0ACB9R4C8_9MYRT|nr:hypothetical protein MLD38_011666 [Melastoma candidum]
MFHMFGLSMILFSWLQMGSTVISMGRFELDSFLKMIEKYRVTHLWVVPVIVRALAKQSAILIPKADWFRHSAFR